MRVIAFAGAFLVLFASPACAVEQMPVAPLPDGWTLGADGSYAHLASRIICSKTMGTYSFVRLEAPTAPNVLGVCVYTGGDMRVGEIRVRKFVDGVGETPMAIHNDRTLMGLEPMQGTPPGAKLMAADRAGPGPKINGKDSFQTVITSLRKQLLVDCVSQTDRSKDETKYGFENFVSSCMHDGE